MHIEVVQGDVLSHPADALICPANCYLNMSGGVNGEILLRGGEAIQRELHGYLKKAGSRSVPPGTVVRTGAGSLPFQHILHAVAIDPFYGSSVELVADTLRNALSHACGLGVRSISLPALATGYGPLSVEQFCKALLDAAKDDGPPLALVTLVLRRSEDVSAAQVILVGC
jgi:O-acetyl-ADP-ribose deacetylase (regulator of RNase III)